MFLTLFIVFYYWLYTTCHCVTYPIVRPCSLLVVALWFHGNSISLFTITSVWDYRICNKAANHIALKCPPKKLKIKKNSEALPTDKWKWYFGQSNPSRWRRWSNTGVWKYRLRKRKMKTVEVEFTIFSALSSHMWKCVLWSKDPPIVPVNSLFGFTSTVMAGKTDNVTVKTLVTHKAIIQI